MPCFQSKNGYDVAAQNIYNSLAFEDYVDRYIPIETEQFDEIVLVFVLTILINHEYHSDDVTTFISN